MPNYKHDRTVTDLEGEIWKEIPNYPTYIASNLGRIARVNPRNKKRSLLKPKFDKDGYYRVNPYINKKNTNACVHRLIAFAFLPLIEGKTAINHLNRVKNDNRIENLEWVNYRENSTHWRNESNKNTSKYTGVSWNECNGSWASVIFDSIAKKSVHLGYFETEEEASIIYQKAALERKTINKYMEITTEPTVQ